MPSFLRRAFSRCRFCRKVPGSRRLGDPALHILLLLAAHRRAYRIFCSRRPARCCKRGTHGRARAPLPYRFYALSNIGSVLALLSYPVLVEPSISSSHQAKSWSVRLRGASQFSAEWLAFCLARKSSNARPRTRSRADRPRPRDHASLWSRSPRVVRRSFSPSPTTSRRTSLSVPFLWVIPLSLYLFSFILCFDSALVPPRFVSASARRGAGQHGLRAVAIIQRASASRCLIRSFAAGLFVCCMFCHGELARLKPDPAHLTAFLFDGLSRRRAGRGIRGLARAAHFFRVLRTASRLGACAILVLVVNHRDPESPFYKARWQPAWLVLVGLVIVICREPRRHGARTIDGHATSWSAISTASCACSMKRQHPSRPMSRRITRSQAASSRLRTIRAIAN